MKTDLLCPPGEPIDLAAAARLVAAYLPGVRTELRQAVATIRRRYPSAPLHLREVTPDEIAAQWSPDLPRVLVAYLMLDDMGHPARWRSVLVLVDKTTGDLIVQDDSGLLGC